MISSVPVRVLRAAGLAAFAGAVLLLSGCGGDDGRDAAAVSASRAGVTVTEDSLDLGSIIIGWGQQYSDTEITTPQPDQVAARCFGRGEDLRVEVSAPHGWQITARHGSQVLGVANIDQQLAEAEIDTTHPLLEEIESVDWSTTDELDVAVTAEAPDSWQGDQRGPVYLSFHIDCR